MTVKKNVTAIGSKAGPLTETAMEQVEGLKTKGELLKVANEAFDEAKALLADGLDKSEAAADKSETGAMALYRLRADKLINAEEVSEILGGKFGWREKKDGTPSKTPAKAGENIRKRIVRAVDAVEYIRGERDKNVPTFLEGVDKDEVKPIVKALVDGTYKINYIYEELGKLKGKRVTAPLHLDPAKLAKLAAAIIQEGVAATVVKSKALRAAYVAIARSIDDLNEEGRKIMAAMPHNDRSDATREEEAA